MHDNILHLCQTIISINISPLNTFTISNQQEFLKHPLLENALTSHLQTSGCSVVIGVKCHEINSVSTIKLSETTYYFQLPILTMQYILLESIL